MKYQAWLLALTLSICGFAHAQTQKPLAQKRLRAELLPSDGTAEMGFGIVAVSGNVVAVTAGSTPGSVYLYPRLSNGTVNQIAKLSASDGAGLFGVAVGENGRLVVAGAPNETIGKHPNQGAVYVFVEPEGGWTGNITETARLTASDGGKTDHDNLGLSVSVTNGVIVAGAPQYQGFNDGTGEVYVYAEPANGWVSGTETARLSASNGQDGDAFGESVGIFGPRVVVGAFTANKTEGVAYVFQEAVGGWKSMTETAQLRHLGTDELFGVSAAVSGKTIVIGAPFALPRGAAFVYVQPPNGWVSTDKPDASLTENGVESKCLGSSMAIGPAMIAVGDDCVRYGHPVRFTGDSVVYLTPSGGWKDSSNGIVLRPEGGQQNSIVAVEKNNVIVGSPWTTVGNNAYEGAAFIYTIPAQ
jgi:FG-GAP repeat